MDARPGTSAAVSFSLPQMREEIKEFEKAVG